MKTLKSMVRQKKHPEGSMSEGYLAQESLFYFGEMLTRLNPSGRQIWNEDMMPKPNKSDFAQNTHEEEVSQTGK
jgi:hypothetical protein